MQSANLGRTRDTLPEASLVERLGGRVEILPYLESYSTTSIIEKIRNILMRSADDEQLDEVGARKNDER